MSMASVTDFTDGELVDELQDRGFTVTWGRDAELDQLRQRETGKGGGEMTTREKIIAAAKQAGLYVTGYPQWLESFCQIAQSDGQRIAELESERDELREQLAAAQAEAMEQARIVGMGGEREIALQQHVKLLRDALVHYAEQDTRNARHYPPEIAKEALTATDPKP